MFSMAKLDLSNLLLNFDVLLDQYLNYEFGDEIFEGFLSVCHNPRVACKPARNRQGRY